MAGDRVIQRKNTEAVINGDLGTVQEILKDDDGVRVCILFDSKNEVLTYDSNDMKNVELAYAITVHSSQGCEFPCCIFPVSSSYGPMLTKPLYYTGITRAKKKLVMIGEKSSAHDPYTGPQISLRTENYQASKKHVSIGGTFLFGWFRLFCLCEEHSKYTNLRLLPLYANCG